MATNRVIGGFEDAFERSQSAVTQGVKQTVKDFTTSAKGQITGGSTSSSSQPHQQSNPSVGSGDQGSNENGSSSQNSQQQDPQKSDVERVEFLKDLYGKSDSKSKNMQNSSAKSAGSVAQALGISQNDPNSGKSPEEIAKIEALRRQLHSDYYQNLLAAAKRKEETVTEKLEREEQEEKMEEFEEQKKKPTQLPATVKQGTGESVVGVSG